MLHWVDIAIIAIVGLSMLTGMIRGFVKELIALCIWVLAFWLAYNYSQSLDPWLQKYIQDKTARTVAAFVLILIATLIAGAIVNGILSIILRRSGLSSTDRILGLAFGFVRGVFIVALIMVVIKMTSLPVDQYSRDSQLYAKFDPLVNWLYSAMPDFIKKVKIFDDQNIRQPIKDLQNKMMPTTSLIDPNDYELSDG